MFYSEKDLRKVRGEYEQLLYKQAGRIMDLEHKLREAKIELKDQKETGNAVLKVIEGGKGGDGNWLAKLPERSIFLCRDKSGAADILMSLYIVAKSDKWALLETSPGVLPYQNLYVDMFQFSLKKELYEVLHTP